MKILVALLLLGQSAAADVVVPTRTIRPESIVSFSDVKLVDGQRQDAFDRLEDVVGQESRVALYVGRPILFSSVGPPALIDRNQIVSLRFEQSGLIITTEGRSLERGGIGDRVRIMNLASRATLFGYVQEDGTVVVKP
ncbi:MAG: flagellar basal body P-ring formation chaperone FlgA [Paracoccaceae bacterium]